MDKENGSLTNITLQTFASEGDAALIDQRWEKDGPAFLKRLFAAGLLFLLRTLPFQTFAGNAHKWFLKEPFRDHTF